MYPVLHYERVRNKNDTSLCFRFLDVKAGKVRSSKTAVARLCSSEAADLVVTSTWVRLNANAIKVSTSDKERTRH